jgi:hypothetical protein
MGRWAFIRLWFRYAFPRAWAIAEVVSGVIAIGGAYVAAHYQWANGAVNDLTWQLPMGVFCAILTLRVCTAPYSMRQDVAIDRERLAKELTKKHVDQRLAEALTQLRRKGLAVAATPLSDAEDAAKFQMAARQWVFETVAAMEACGCSLTDREAFHLPSYLAYTSLAFAEYANDQWNLEKKAMYYRIDVLGSIIDSYLERPVFAFKQ